MTTQTNILLEIAKAILNQADPTQPAPDWQAVRA